MRPAPFIVFFVLVVAHFQSVSGEVPDVEISALFQLYNCTNGTSWQWLDEEENGPKWNFTSFNNGDFAEDPCSNGWQGLTCSDTPLQCSNKTCHITAITLPGYELSGSIPSEIGDFANLSYLYLHRNSITGSIPVEIGDLWSLEELVLYYNLLSGSIPVEMSKLIHLVYLDLDYNNVGGSIPKEMGNLSNLIWLFLYNNVLTGTIPSEIGNLVKLEYLDLDLNLLGGSIPREVGKLLKLQSLDLDFNLLSGSIPTELGNLHNLMHLDFDDNALTGSIPREVGNLVNLKWLSMYYNFLTGSIPTELGNLVSLEWLQLFSNSLTGSIPSEMNRLTNLKWLYLEENELTGCIPDSIGDLMNLTQFSISHNALTGSVPNAMSRLAKLTLLFLQSNQFSGNIEHTFDANGQLLLEVLDLSDNLLTGSIGDDIFRLPAIRTLAISVNCFEAELRGNMCTATTLHVMSLNGLAAAGRCNNRVKFPISGVAMFNTIGGTLPQCVWLMPNLEVLHAVGNGLTGDLLVQQLPNSSRMIDLSLSHNRFTGTIPQGIEKIRRVDLSHNQFSHKYLDHQKGLPREMLNLEINRLSGQLHLPTLKNVSELTMLRGNMFSCESIPENDKHEQDYICGSSDFDESIFVFSVAFFCAACAVVAVLVLWRLGSDLINCPQWIVAPAKRLRWYLTYVTVTNTKKGDALLPIVTLCAKLKTVVKLFAQLLGVIMLVTIPIYSARGSDEDTYSTHSNTYAWFWTLAYMHGTVPAALVLAAWSIALGVCFYRIMLTPLLHDTPPVQAAVSRPELNYQSADAMLTHNEAGACETGGMKTRWIKAGVLLGNAAISITVNSLYLYSTQQELSPMLHFGCQSTLAVFRLAYSATLPILFQPIIDPVAKIKLWMRMLIVDNLVVPCLVTAFASPSCFQGLIVAASEVSTPYSYDQCYVYQFLTPSNVICFEYESIVATSAPVVPPFVYSNQCSSVLLTSFIPVILIGCSIQLVSTLVIQVLYYQLGTVVDLSQHMWGILFPEVWQDISDSDRVSRMKSILKNKPSKLLNFSSILCLDVLSHAMIMLTFGICSPVLAFAVACVVALKMSRLVLVVGRFTAVLCGDDDNSSSGDSGEEGMHFALATLCAMKFPLAEALRQSFWLFAWASGLFFALICWDIAGDEVGWLDSLWVPVWAMSYPAVLWTIAVIAEYQRKKLICLDGRVQEESRILDSAITTKRQSDVELSSRPSRSYVPPLPALFPTPEDNAIYKNVDFGGRNPMHSPS